ncbi:MAG: hypothetical protein HDS38_04530 [Bacteroides sp.]|nr:hypothetical protein [Bacteroides sp.]
MDKERRYFSYVKGQERSEVVEKSDFEKSIFSEQYSQALRLIDSFLHNYQKDSCQILAFCGDRGEGKSSCLKTTHTILNALNKQTDKDDENGGQKHCIDKIEELNREVSNYLKSLQIDNLSDAKFEILEIIDPTFFDKGHNVQELVVGQLYTKFRELYFDKSLNRVSLNNLLKQFERVKHCVTTLKKAESGQINEYDELETLAYSMTLKGEIQKLIAGYLDLQGKKDGKLLITIDDIDLNMEEAYRMCEQIRKYFSNKDVIVLLAVKLDQLRQAVSRALKQSSDPNRDLINSSDIMAEKYLAKFLPVNVRINMPTIFDFTDRYLKIGDKSYDGRTIMDTILELIFQRTRYLFYNSMGVVSPLIPSNLRGFLQLLGLLGEMHNLDKYNNEKQNPEFKRKLEENKHRFKNYFFIEWLRRLPSEVLPKVLDLINLADFTLFNKKVCSILKDIKNAIEERTYDSEEDEEWISDISSSSKTVYNPVTYFDSIVNPANFAYNVSVGDVFYIISLLEKVDLSSDQQNLLFFIKSLYSIRLYESYDVVTEMKDDYYSDKKALKAGIYRYDSNLTDTNELQRLTGGSYFSYPSNSLLGISTDHGQSIDCCILDTSSGINKLCIDASYATENNWRAFFKGEELAGQTPEEHLKFLNEHDQLAIAQGKREEGEKLLHSIRAFKTMEFLALTICQSVTQKELTRDQPDKLRGNFRKNITPAFLTKFNKTFKKYVMFDVMAPFSSLVNPYFTYNRWNAYIPGFYNTAINSPWSLLRKMIGKAVWRRLGEEAFMDYDKKEFLTSHETFQYLHILQSDAVIRNGEVLAAMYENVTLYKRMNKRSATIDHLNDFYRSISSSSMATYSVSPNESDGYPISFSFLNAIEENLEDIMKDYEIEKILFDTFTKNSGAKPNSSVKDSVIRREALPIVLTQDQWLFNEISELLQGRVLNGTEIRKELAQKNKSFANLKLKEKLLYIRTKKDEKMDASELFAYITRNPSRKQRWIDLLVIF